MEPVGFQSSWPSNQVNSGAINAAWTLFDAGRQQPRPPKSWRPKLQPRSERTAAFFGSGKERKIRFLILRMCGGRMSECPLWVISGHSAVQSPCPLPPKADMCGATRDVRLGQKRTFILWAGRGKALLGVGCPRRSFPKSLYIFRCEYWPFQRDRQLIELPRESLLPVRTPRQSPPNGDCVL